jgi:hypothetical protein
MSELSQQISKISSNVDSRRPAKRRCTISPYAGVCRRPCGCQPHQLIRAAKSSLVNAAGT